MSFLSNKFTCLYPANNGIQQAIKNKIRDKFDPSGDVINITKHFLYRCL